MENCARYALYYVPPAGSALARLGASWLGRDIGTGEDVAHPVPGGACPPVAQITCKPRRYGLHATLKAPFRLAGGEAPGALLDAARVLATQHRAFEAPPLRLSRPGRFLALVPEVPCPALDALAGSCVRDLDRFRAPMTGAERARRRPERLSQGKRAYLDRWGYPFVFDAFRFHITLTGALPPDVLDAAEDALRGYLSPVLGAAMPVREIALAGEDGDGRFRVIARLPLTQ